MREAAGQEGLVLTIRSTRVTPVLVPMTYALGTSAARVTEAPLLLIDLETEEGITGRTYLFCYRPSGARAIALLLEDAASLIEGEHVRPAEVAAKLARRFALIGVTGTVRMALSALLGRKPNSEPSTGDFFAGEARLTSHTRELLGTSATPPPRRNAC